MTNVIGFGAGGHARVILDTLKAIGGFEVVGFLDPNPTLWGKKILGVRVLGGDDLSDEMLARGVRSAFIGVGSIELIEPRKRLYETARKLGFGIVRSIHPRAVISESAVLGDGPMVMAGAIINPAARIGNNVIINTGAIVEHTCVIGDHSHIAVGARLAGNVRIGERSHVGIGASILEGTIIGNDVIVGAGAVVIRNVPDKSVVVGVPAEIIRTVES
jgi:sugar O-acyltransferase (sialic acid O-acetyltransferase NeuD family)